MSGEFILTIGDSAQIPNAIREGYLKGHQEPRIAMVGRSNVGKSSLINSLLGTRLAQTSADPGKTRLLHFYLWKEAKKILADLPGYGFAKTSHDERERWAGFIGAYLDQDPALERAIVLLDARHGPTESDKDAIRFLSLKGIPVTLVFTKADTLKGQSERVKRRRDAERMVKELGFDPGAAHWVSVKTKDGLKGLQSFLLGDQCHSS